MECFLAFQVKNQKDQGSYEDFLECLKLYDKAENGTMLGAELEHSLKALGESSRRSKANWWRTNVLSSSSRWKIERRWSCWTFRRLHGPRRWRWQRLLRTWVLSRFTCNLILVESHVMLPSPKKEQLVNNNAEHSFSISLLAPSQRYNNNGGWLNHPKLFHLCASFIFKFLDFSPLFSRLICERAKSIFAWPKNRLFARIFSRCWLIRVPLQRDRQKPRRSLVNNYWKNTLPSLSMFRVSPVNDRYMFSVFVN